MVAILTTIQYNKNMKKKKYFHEVIEEDEKMLAIGLKQSRLHKKERLEREKIRQANMQSDNIEMEKLKND